ncbi:Sec-independent protein translocase protein TatB [Ancylobacter sp. A5.8]|uniref:Sec-independent protein translocase protein TatB n=1 Tax=Ancylobacter gelatini TaxID=2919920 RepID=UPI001F4E1101|nr:Sec-independent protein translocase protein TatB [Ancylobacter gelatini]MCJ8143173.1 Sec-independent protein translocase protein TatB [Ancylobacter gelatini]
MFDIGWSEFLVVGIVALVVIGPKELPGVLRTVGKSVGKLRRMAGEFQGQFQEALREADLVDLKKDLTGFADDAKGTVSSFVDDTKNSISGALPSNPLLDIESELKAATTGVERADLPSADPVQAQLPEPTELESNAFETIEDEVRNAAAKLDTPSSLSAAASVPVPPAPVPPVASATPAASAAPVPPEQPKRVRKAKEPAAGGDAVTEPAPKPKRVRAAKTSSAEPEVADAVAALDGPAPNPPAKPRRKPRVKAPGNNDEGPAA